MWKIENSDSKYFICFHKGLHIREKMFSLGFVILLPLDLEAISFYYQM
jgi:hypothetical protein